MMAIVFLLVACSSTSTITSSTNTNKQATSDIPRSIPRWKLIVNDDGEIPPPNANRTVDQTLNDRFNAIRNTQVDAYFLCIASTDRVVGKSAARPQDAMSQWAKYGDVPEHVDQMIRAYIREAHKEGIDIIFAARLNDIHDAWAAKLTYPLKVSRPDLLLSTKTNRPKDALLDAHWSGFNWAEPEVRKHFYDFLMWACEKWDFDGVELDWFRHPLFFRFGEEQANIENINQWVRDVRAGLNKIAAKRGRRYLLTARPPDSPKLALRTGFDAQQWMKDGSLDMLMVGGGYMPYGPRLKEFIDMAHKYGIAAYPCQNHYIDIKKMHSIASGFWAMGGDGFYMFNYGGIGEKDPRWPCIDQIGDTKTLAGLDKTFIADTGQNIRYIGHTNPMSQFPKSLIGGDAIEIVVGDDLANVTTPVRATLTIKVSELNNVTNLTAVVQGATSDEDIILNVNGKQLPNDTARRVDATTFIAVLPLNVLINGINRIRVMAGPRCLGRLSSKVESMQLEVDYDPEGNPSGKSASGDKPASDKTLIKSSTKMPVILFGVSVGTTKNIDFKIEVDLSQYSKVQLALNAEDIDEPAEVVITLNGGKPLAISKELLSASGRAVGMMDVPLSQLKKGDNTFSFKFASNLGGTTGGFDIYEAMLVLTPNK
jgi:hypothetical protein